MESRLDTSAIRDQLRNAVHHRGFIWSDGIYAISKFLPGQDNGFDSNFDVNHLLNIHGNDIGLAYWRRIVANLRVLSTAKIYGLQQDLAHLLPEYDL
ncbi:hypothetical protein BCV70DRAFT_201053 [Testicularia cyperi]|uniref:Uncharacterized protein n=1 Tax=Testicularia cyperi TaxID=1882483 RepID=A0A317XMD5_9BASI|nr:hypothetical protein BCV70DRAFT_201053 [Testicularia cyperi]